MAKSGRGKFCRECYSCWRTVYQEEHTLYLFGLHLKTAANRTLWERDLVSFLSLVHDGAAKITKGMVGDRRRSLEFTLGLMGVPFDASTVVLVGDTGKKADFADKAGGRLCQFVNVETPAGLRVGMFVPKASYVAPPGSFAQPGAGVPMLKSRDWLVAEDDTDREWCRAFEGSPLRLAGPSSSKAVVPSGSSRSPDVSPMSKLAGKLEVLQAVCQESLAPFRTGGWEEMKEASLTSALARVTGLAADAGASGEDAVVQRAEPLVKGVSLAKSFLRQWRECNKSKDKHDKFTSMAATVRGLHAFLSGDMQGRLAPSFQLMFLRSEYYSITSAAFKDPQMKAALEVLVSHDLPSFFTESEKASVTLDGWLRSLVAHTCSEFFAQADPTAVVEVDATRLHKDVAESLALLTERLPEDLIRGSLDHLRHMSCLLRSAFDVAGLSVDGVRAATVYLESLAAASLKRAVENSGLGKEVLGRASGLLKTSARDVLGDKKVADALKMLEEPRLPHAACEDDRVTVANFEGLVGLGVLDTLQDSTSHIAEAVNMWSAGALEQGVSLVEAWWATVLDRLRFYDNILSIFATALAHGSGDGPQIEGQKDGESEDEVSDAEGDREDFADEASAALPHFEFQRAASARYLAHGVDEEDWLAFLVSLKGFLESLPQKLSERAFVEDGLRALEVIEQNHQARQAARAWVEAAGAFASSLPQSGEALLQEWKAKQATRQSHTSFAHLGARLLARENDVLGAALVLHDTDSRVDDTMDWVMVVGAGASSATFAATLARTRHFLGFLLCSRANRFVALALQASVKVVFTELSSCLRLKALALNYDSAAPSDLEAVSCWFHNVLNGEEVSQSAAIAAKAHGRPQGAEPEWPARAAAQLMAEVCGPVPDNMFKVNMSPLCSPAGQPPVCTSKSAFLALCAMFVLLSEVACSLSLLCQGASSPGGQDALRERSLKVELERGMTFLQRETIVVGGRVAALLRQHPQMAAWPLTFSLTDATRWCDMVVQATPMVLRSVLNVQVASIGALGAEVQALTPRYDHVLGDTTFHRALCKKQVLEWGGRRSLNAAIVSLFQAISEGSRIHAILAFPVPFREEPLWKETLSAAQSIYEQAKAAVVVIAGLNVLIELSGKEQVAQAASLLARATTMPGALRLALEKLVPAASRSGPSAPALRNVAASDTT